jgi:hypothetical protein
MCPPINPVPIGTLFLTGDGTNMKLRRHGMSKTTVMILTVSIGAFIASCDLDKWPTGPEGAFIQTAVINKTYCDQNCVVFTGDSVIHYLNLDYLLGERVCNAALGMQKIDYVVLQYNWIKLIHPRQFFVHIGTNNMEHGKVTAAEILPEYQNMVRLYRGLQPDTELFFISVLPFAPDSYNRNPIADELNAGIKNICDEEGATFIDIHDYFHDERYFADGTHLSPEGWTLFASLIKPYIH